MGNSSSSEKEKGTYARPSDKNVAPRNEKQTNVDVTVVSPDRSVIYRRYQNEFEAYINLSVVYKDLQVDGYEGFLERTGGKRLRGDSTKLEPGLYTFVITSACQQKIDVEKAKAKSEVAKAEGEVAKAKSEVAKAEGEVAKTDLIKIQKQIAQVDLETKVRKQKQIEIANRE